MKIIICLDDENGMMFNNRRQSQDCKLREYILNLTNQFKLYMNSYSYEQYANEKCNNVIVCEDFLEKALKDDYCFVENKYLSNYIGRIDEFIIYRWNRRYPSDFNLDIDINNLKLVESKDFKGNSHEKITEERYINE